MQLTQTEQLALDLLKSQPQILQRLAQPGSMNIEINDLHNFYHRLSFSLKCIEDHRKKNYVDVEIVPLNTSKEDKKE